MSSLKDRGNLPSRYLTGEFFDALLAWRAAASSYGRVTDFAAVQECAALLHHEARLLDSRRFEEWLGLYTDECLHWVPMDDEADPRQTVNISFDDRRRLEDRVVRITTGFAHNQEPDRRMRHLVSNIEAWEAPDGQSRRVMAQEQVFEHRTGRHGQHYVAQLDYWLVREGGDWKIKVKRAMLIDSLDGLETPTLL